MKNPKIFLNSSWKDAEELPVMVSILNRRNSDFNYFLISNNKYNSKLLVDKKAINECDIVPVLITDKVGNNSSIAAELQYAKARSKQVIGFKPSGFKGRIRKFYYDNCEEIVEFAPQTVKQYLFKKPFFQKKISFSITTTVVPQKPQPQSVANPIPLISRGTSSQNRHSIFIVSGHDDKFCKIIEDTVEQMGLHPVILKKYPNSGCTIIEKLEYIIEKTKCKYAIILYTPCDEGRIRGTDQFQPRARQNVVFEHGYLIGKLGRANTVIIQNETNIETPSDTAGIVSIPYLKHDYQWRNDLFKELVNYHLNPQKYYE